MCGAIDKPSPLLYQLAEVIWPFTVEIHLLFSGRMDEAQCLGMECLTWTYLETVLDESLVTAATLSPQNFGATISLIHEEGMPYLFHVSTYLMGSARLQDALHQSGITKSLQHLVMGNGTFADSTIWVKHLHTKTILRVSPDIAFYASLILDDVAPNQGIVSAMRGFVEELLTQ